MRNEWTRRSSGAGEFAVIAALLSVYGLAIFLCPDPEWLVWAGQMTMGVIDPSASAPAYAQPVDALRTASALGALGALSAAALLAAAAGAHPGRLARLFERAVAGHASGRSGGEPPA